MIELATSDPRVKTQLFRFVDVLPVLGSFEQKKAHLLEYVSRPQEDDSHDAAWPWSLRALSRLLKLKGADRLLVRLSDFQVKQMGKNFILGENLENALPKLLKKRAQKIGFTLDILGEGVFSEEEAAKYLDRYTNLIQELGKKSKNWIRISPIDDSPIGPVPPVNISIKVSALDCRMDPLAFEDSLTRLEKRLEPLLAIAVRNNVFINFDMEQFAMKDLTRELFKRLILKPEFRNYRHVGIVVQAYLRSARSDIENWIDVAHKRGTPFTIRLVKGAYWDYETIISAQNGWEAPVFLKKSDSDSNFEACTRILLEAFPEIEIAVGSHNLRSIAYALAYAEALQLPTNSFEVQMLYGMADPFKEGLVKKGIRIREYDPIGEMLPGLSYLVRRLLENTSNDSFLKQSFMDNTGIHELLKNPSPSWQRGEE